MNGLLGITGQNHVIHKHSGYFVPTMIIMIMFRFPKLSVCLMCDLINKYNI